MDRRRVAVARTRYRDLHAGADGSRRDRVHARVAPMRRMPRRERTASRGATTESRRCRHRARRRRRRNARCASSSSSAPARSCSKSVRRRASGPGCGACPRSTSTADVVRHCKARFAANVVAGANLPVIEHAFTHYRLTIHPQRVAARSWPLRAEAPGLLWLTRDDALAAALPAPIRKLLRTRLTGTVGRRGALLLRRPPVAQIRGQQLFVIGMCGTKRGELPGRHRRCSPPRATAGSRRSSRGSATARDPCCAPPPHCAATRPAWPRSWPSARVAARAQRLRCRPPRKGAPPGPRRVRSRHRALATPQERVRATPPPGPVRSPVSVAGAQCRSVRSDAPRPWPGRGARCPSPAPGLLCRRGGPPRQPGRRRSPRRLRAA